MQKSDETVMQFLRQASVSILICLFSLFANARPMCVVKEGAKLREAPNNRSKISWTVGKYMPFFEIARKGGWSQVADLEDQTHWILSSEISSRLRCLVVRTSVIDLRTGPGRTYASATPMAIADRYTPFRDLGGEDGWIKVRDSFGSESWIPITSIWKPTVRASARFSEP